MQVLPLVQNSEEWLEWRLGRSGGSEFKKTWTTSLPLKTKLVQKLERVGKKLTPAEKRMTAEEMANMLTPDDLANLKLESEPKAGYYELIANRVARQITPNDYVDRLNGEPFSMMARGHLLEPEALQLFSTVTGKFVHPESCVWVKEGNDKIYISPDGVICSEEEMELPIEEIVAPTEAAEVKCLGSPEIVKAYLTSQYPQEYLPQVLKYFIVNQNLKTLYFILYTDVIPGLELQTFVIHRHELERLIAEAEAFEVGMMERAEADIAKIERLGF